MDLPGNNGGGVSFSASKSRLTLKLGAATTAAYRSARGAIKDAQTAELANVPRVFATKAAALVKTQETLQAIPKQLSDMEVCYEVLMEALEMQQKRKE